MVILNVTVWVYEKGNPVTSDESIKTYYKFTFPALPIVNRTQGNLIQIPYIN